MRILVADDEALVRFGIISVLEEILPQSLTIIEASNGKELITRAKDSRPHIGFVDIRMPGMDGLEAIEKAREYASKTLWVIVSGHGDFAYARKAMKLGVEDFLLKPVDPDELKELFKRLGKKAKERQCSGNRDLEAKVSAVIGDTTSPEYDSWFTRTRYWQAAMVLWDSILPDEDIIKKRRLYAGRIQQSLDSGDEYSGCIVSIPGGALLIVLTTPVASQPMDKIISLWNKRFPVLRNSNEDICGDEIGDTWFLTQVVQEPDELFREVTNLGNNAPLRYIHRPKDINNFRDVIDHLSVSRYSTAAEILEDLKNTYRYGEEDDFHGLSHRLVESAESLSDNTFESGGSYLYSHFAIPLDAPWPESLQMLATRLHNDSHQLFADRPITHENGTNAESLAIRALDVMNQRYRETIGIAQVAEELGVTPNYLSTVFKKEIGTSFTRKLTELRLEKASELLGRPNANIGEIARSLGYQSSRHFTRLFKEKYGQPPSQWIDRR